MSLVSMLCNLRPLKKNSRMTGSICLLRPSVKLHTPNFTIHIIIHFPVEAQTFQTGVLSEQSFASTQHSGLRRQENLAAKGSETDCTPSSSISGPTEHVLSGRRRKQRVICGWDDCHKTMTRGSLRRHHTEVHEGRKRKKTRTGEGAPHDAGPE